ncbi:MAG: tetrathionate reductase family octaheme c-type cytochrome [bacterium]|nr:tetrathionate reductase family octaheme c-type cytochrome [bacterium]
MVIIPILLSFPSSQAASGSPWRTIAQKKTHLDHSPFFTTKFNTPQEVTKACLECHGNAAKSFMKTAHWTWEGKPVTVPGHQEPMKIGKKNLLNNFCIGIKGNWSSCTICHAGYGWEDGGFDFTKEENVDCLICHDWSGTYAKGKKGLPQKGTDLLAAARKVGYPRRANCGTCHIYGGGGMGVKHGDLDNTLVNPTRDIDVHMGKYNILCIDCHKTENHDITGKAYSVSLSHENGIGCTDCHPGEPHINNRLNAHLSAVACQTCHIPTFAKKAPTKTHWDWSKAGDPDREENPHHYLKIKGEFIYGKNLVPEYAWFNLKSHRYIMGDKFDPEETLVLNKPGGDINDDNAKIWPFKIHRATQPYDKENKYLLQPVTSGEGGYWNEFDWDKAFRLAEDLTGLKYSGSYGFARTDMYWPLSHMVSPASAALRCYDCHGENARLDWKALGYKGDPAKFGGRKTKRVIKEKEETEEHTEISLMDKDGNEVVEPGAAVSAETTCGECHEIDEINSHNIHYKKAKVGCIGCHFKEGKIGNDYAQAHLRIQMPASENCLSCHGIAHTGPEPLTIPADYLDTTAYEPGKTYYGMTQGTGVILSHQVISDSGLNIKDKAERTAAWDVHARLHMDCISCHYTKKGEKKGDGHDLNTASCKTCHDPLASHDHLAYKEKHLEVLSCQSCHVPAVYGPAFKAVDKTVLRLDGSPRVELRGTDEAGGSGNSLNTGYYRGYLPSLFLHEENRISPFNLVTEWYWRPGDADEPVPAEIIKKVYLEPTASQYADDVLKVFDKNGDKKIDDRELVLDNGEKIGLIKKKLSALGIREPVIAGVVQAHRIKHGMAAAGKMKWSCSVCHAGDSKFGRDILLADRPPGAPETVIPTFAKNLQPAGNGVNGDITVNNNGKILLKRTAGSGEYYVMGYSRTPWLDRLGLWLFLAAAAFMVVFWGTRYVRGLKQTALPLETAPPSMYGFYEKLWYRVLAAGIVILAVTGLEIHYTGYFSLFGLHHAVRLHNLWGIILAVNGVLVLLHHLFTGKLKQFFILKRRRVNIVLLGVLLPFQAVTGILIWLADLRLLCPVHGFGAWLFLAFAAIYLAGYAGKNHGGKNE